MGQFFALAWNSIFCMVPSDTFMAQYDTDNDAELTIQCYCNILNQNKEDFFYYYHYSQGQVSFIIVIQNIRGDVLQKEIVLRIKKNVKKLSSTKTLQK